MTEGLCLPRPRADGLTGLISRHKLVPGYNVHMKSSRKSLWGPLIVLTYAGIALLLAGCVDPAMESDWRWKQFNPGYRSPYPENPNPWRTGIF